MNNEKLEKLKKFYRLATNNSNQNESAVAALKFVKQIQENGLQVFLYTEGNEPFTLEKVKEIVNKECQKAYQQGFNEAVKRVRQEQQEVQRQRETMAGTGIVMNTATTGGNAIYFNGRRMQ